MKIPSRISRILSHYESDNPGTKANLVRILMAGKLGGTGKMVILPVDQGFEHGPAVSFGPNPGAYDPHYHYKLAIEAGLNAYAAPFGMLAAGADTYAGSIPLILKANSSNALLDKGLAPDQAMTSTVEDALHLGCSAIGFTIYPGSDNSLAMMEEVSEMARRARSYGLAVVMWSYARGGIISKEGETALDIIAYAAHMAALLGAHIIKVKLPSKHIELESSMKHYNSAAGRDTVDFDDMKDRVAHVMKASLDARRLVVFSGGAAKDNSDVYAEARAIAAGGGNGSIIGRNTFQRPREMALQMLSDIIAIYKGVDSKSSAQAPLHHTQ